MISVTVNNTDLMKLKRLSENLQKNVERALKKDTRLYSKMIQKSAKLRAPRFTGQLSESITAKPTKNGAVVEVGSAYGYFQEYGFTPRFLQAGMPVLGGYRILDWMQAKGIRGAGIKPSGKAHPFIAPAVEITTAKIPSLLSKSIAQAIKKS